MIVKVSAAISLDGYLDDDTSQRLILSSEQDWNEVRHLRARYDAILVGAETLRKDNPSLTVQEEFRTERQGQGLPADPLKVTVSRRGKIDPGARFFTEGAGEKLVIVGADADSADLERLQTVATVIKSSMPELTAREIIRILAGRGIGSLFVEGGSHILTLFFAEDAVDYFRLAVAPFFVGAEGAVRLVLPEHFPFDKGRRMHLIGAKAVGDMAVAEYALRYNREDYELLQKTIALAEKAPRSESAYSVGALIVTAAGQKFPGYSRETDEHNHAEEEAIAKAVAAGESLEGATIYSSMEPCSARKSKPLSCSGLIIKYKMKRVVFGTYEPPWFVVCEGARRLREAGVEVVVIEELADAALAVNRHIREALEKVSAVTLTE